MAQQQQQPQAVCLPRARCSKLGSSRAPVKQFLSEGGHANVYLVTMISTGTTKVLKHIKFAHDEPEHRQRVEKEIQLMRQLSGHANIVALDDAEIGDGQAPSADGPVPR
ncbi:hypothetical protein DL89DRAFT_289020 [Linderina pennispora]|uniref:non-specific serine/threonine protein kinase n=1 Tax=Linderina pennispora TaxID=61395 RepID=A0A1Y1VQS7_9FUNG|nr:uncharacterized protein DL89DRAFT_289020 [Linderina pennispora]ORX63649.1 hypothetical protein DL89DRAFT_289020 [Linderina pennispora]